MKAHSKLKSIATALLNDNSDPLILSKAIKEYQALLMEQSSIDPENDRARTNIHSEKGKALGTT